MNSISFSRLWPSTQAPVPSSGSDVKPESCPLDRTIILSNPFESFSPSTADLKPYTAAEAVTAATQLLRIPALQEPAKDSIDIKTVQDQLTRELPNVEVDFLNTDSFGKLNGRLATEPELIAMMESLTEESGIPFGYIKDGCYARAHLMDESFRQHGINHAKMFVRGDLAAKNKHMEARWWYHVAPLVFVDDGSGHPVAKVIDPGFSAKPMNPEDWVKAMNRGPSIEVDLVDAEQYYPREYSKPDTFSESLPPAVSRMQSYARKLHDVKKNQGQDVGDFTKPTWDTPGSGGDFEIGGVSKAVFPEGVKSTGGRFLMNSSHGNHATLVELEPTSNESEISAAWENRPAGFNPYQK